MGIASHHISSIQSLVSIDFVFQLNLLCEARTLWGTSHKVATTWPVERTEHHTIPVGFLAMSANKRAE
jgi:hypothetical protein